MVPARNIGLFVASRHALTLAMLVTLSACARPQNVAVEERATVAGAPVLIQRGNEYQRLDQGLRVERRGPAHTVQAKDTLYSIAFMHQLSVDDLMCWNSIRDSRRLQIGQTLTLIEPSPTPQCGAELAVAAAKQDNQAVATSKALPQASKRLSQHGNRSAELRWSWPVQGQLLERFSVSARRQGIVIAIPSRTPIKAAASGTVVYRGNALKGYGNLLILNHANGYLSAYAHTQEILVKEGQEVRMSDVIALAGEDTVKRAAVHFQIRKDGNPIDPLPLLN